MTEERKNSHQMGDFGKKSYQMWVHGEFRSPWCEKVREPLFYSIDKWMDECGAAKSIKRISNFLYNPLIVLVIFQAKGQTLAGFSFSNVTIRYFCLSYMLMIIKINNFRLWKICCKIFWHFIDKMLNCWIICNLNLIHNISSLVATILWTNELVHDFRCLLLKLAHRPYRKTLFQWNSFIHLAWRYKTE